MSIVIIQQLHNRTTDRPTDSTKFHADQNPWLPLLEFVVVWDGIQSFFCGFYKILHISKSNYKKKTENENNRNSIFFYK